MNLQSKRSLIACAINQVEAAIAAHDDVSEDEAQEIRRDVAKYLLKSPRKRPLLVEKGVE